MKTICKILVSVIISSALLASLSACFNPNTVNDGESTPSVTSSSVTSPYVKLIENGLSAFKIVVPQYADDEQYSRFEKFKSSFKNKTGVTLAYVSESVASYENDNYEILIGQVNRKESEEIFSQLKNNEYFYGVVGNKLVILGKSYADLDEAIHLFFRKVIDAEENCNTSLLLNSEINYFYRYDYIMQNIFIGNTSIKNYSIVYSKDDRNAAFFFANKFANLVLSLTGIEIPVIDDSNDATPYEIVIGNSTRGTPSSATKDKFSVICKEGKLYFGSHYAYGYDSLYLYIRRILSNTITDAVTFENGFSYEESYANSLIGGTENILGRGGSIRAIFHNVLIHDRDTCPTAWRARYALDVYSDYAPDIIGLQEMQGSIRTYIATGLKNMGYVEVPYTEKNSTFKFVEDPVFYNPETLTLITSGAYRFNEKTDKNKCIGWALFEEKATGKQFIVASTHYAWLSNPEKAAELRIQHAEMTVELLENLAYKFKVPIIIGGDFNCNVEGDPYAILERAKMKDVENLAQKTEDRATHHSEPVFDTSTEMCKNYSSPVGGNDSSAAIDHIFAYNHTKIIFNTYDVITDNFALASSDHCPLLVDFTLG